MIAQYNESKEFATVNERMRGDDWQGKEESTQVA